MLEQRVRKQPCLHVGGGNAEMAMANGHFYEPEVNIASPPWVLLSTVHVAAQIKLLNCYLLVASGVWFIYRRVQMFCPIFLFFCLESTFTVVCLLLFDPLSVLRLCMSTCFEDSLKVFSLSIRVRIVLYFRQAGQWVEISPRVSVWLAAVAAADDVYLAGSAGISKNSTY